MPGQQRFRGDEGGHFGQDAPAQHLRLGGQPAALVIAQTEPTSAQLLAQDAVLFAKVVDDLQLVLIHPAGDGDQYEAEGIQRLQHRIAYCRAGWGTAANRPHFQSHPVSGPYDLRRFSDYDTCPRTVWTDPRKPS